MHETDKLSTELSKQQRRLPSSKSAKQEVLKRRDELMTDLNHFYGVDKRSLEDEIERLGVGDTWAQQVEEAEGLKLRLAEVRFTFLADIYA